MIQIIKEIRVEVSKPNFFQAIVAKQYDVNSRYLKATFVNDGVVIPIKNAENVQATINAKRPDGASFAFYGAVKDDNTVLVPIHSEMLMVDGEVKCDISVITTTVDENGETIVDKRLTSTTFSLLVERAAFGNGNPSDDSQSGTAPEGTAGVPGEDGYSPTIEIIAIEGGNRLTITDVNGEKTVDIMNGKDGAKGDKGDKGEQGIQGPQGEKGDKGDTGPQGEKGDKGATGAAGKDGYTPVKGTDYFTDEDKAEIVNELKNTVPEYTSVTNGVTKLQHNGVYVVKGTYIEDAFGGEKVRIRGKEEDIHPYKALSGNTLDDYWGFASRKSAHTPRPDSPGYSIAVDEDGVISFVVPTVADNVTGEPVPFTWHDTAWLWYNRKVRIPDLKFGIDLPYHNLKQDLNDGVGFFLFTRLSSPDPTQNIELNSNQGFIPGAVSFADKIACKDQNLILFMFTPCYKAGIYGYRLKVGSVCNGENGFDTMYSTQIFKNNDAVAITFDEEARVYVNGEKVLWGDDGVDWRYISAGLIPDYRSRAYFGFAVTNFGDTHFSMGIQSIFNMPFSRWVELELDPQRKTAASFRGGWRVSGLTEEDTVPYTLKSSPKLNYTDADGVTHTIEYIKEEDLTTFWGDTTCLGKNGCITKHFDGIWRLYTRKLDGEPISFTLTETANETLNNYPPFMVYDKAIAEGNIIGAKVEYYSEIAASKPVLWDGTASDHHLCDFKTFDNENHKAKVKIATDGVITWKNSFENGTDGVQALAFYKL